MKPGDWVKYKRRQSKHLYGIVKVVEDYHLTLDFLYRQKGEGWVLNPGIVDMRNYFEVIDPPPNLEVLYLSLILEQ